MINKAIIIGNLVRDLELKKTNTGKSVVKFTIAVNDFNGNANYFDCVAWNKTAEFINSYASKGNKVCVEGRLSQRTYDNSEGKKVNVIEIVADQVELLTPKEAKEEYKPYTPKESVKELQKGTDFETGALLDISDDDLPF